MSATDFKLEAWLLSNLVGESPRFLESVGLVRRFANSMAPLLITGETGTGKEFAARAAHYLGDRRGAAFIPVNCGALPDSLVESELFGHAKGAFTDASRARPGLVCEAQGGTLFLDEIEALSTRGQVVLLRFLQDAIFRSVGEERRRQADVRVVAASNVDLERLVECGGFRSDLLFRLNVLSVELPALRDRIDDILPLAAHFLGKAAAAEGGEVKSLSMAAGRMLAAHSWPGNVRELEHVLRRAHLLTNGREVSAEDLERACPKLASRHLSELGSDHQWLLEQKQRAIREVERRFVERALVRSNGNISEAARQCHMERAAFSKLVKKSRSAPPIQLTPPGVPGDR